MTARTARQRPALELLVPCVNLRPDGAPCGRPGTRGLPAGVCDEHAMAVFRAVVALGGLVKARAGASAG